jgi:hypothetical protein
MRQGRGDDDYSSLFRQYVPAGHSLKSDRQVSNGEDDQPRFAGLDEEKRAEPEQIAETAAVESNVPARAEARLDAEQAALSPSPGESRDEGSQPAPMHAMAVAADAPQSLRQGGSEAEAIAPSVSSDEAGSEAPRGWGGFWRRRTED